VWLEAFGVGLVVGGFALGMCGAYLVSSEQARRQAENDADSPLPTDAPVPTARQAH
jgi:hypothetical protein